MYESHAPPYAGHRGIQSTLRAIETYFYWPTMKRDIPDYVSKCVVCQKTKFDRGKQPGLLQPLPIPDSPWESISMDFIFGLPKSIHGNTGIWTIVDRFSKQAYFIPVKKTIKAHQMATLFISQIFKYHGLPSSIVSDRDPRMTSNFWKGLFENLGTRLNFSSAYHPQTDGQSEIANLTIVDLLKSYVTEVDQRSQWEKYLPLVEYAYNNTVHTSTGKAPFEVIEGRSKSPLLLKVHGKIFVADEYSRDLKEYFQNMKEAISISQQKQKAAANKHRRALAFKENDWVLLKFPKARLRHTSGKNPTGHQKYYAKLAKRYYGPFQILKPINEMAYQLKLPNHWLIHNAFHVSLHKPYKGEPPSEAKKEDPPEVEDQEEVLQPESILRHEDKDSSLMATRSEQLNWQEIYLSEDEASAQGTHAVRFLVQQVKNLMRAHGLQLLNYEHEGNAREERGAHSQDDASSGRSRSPSRRIRRPLEREDNSLRYEVQESGSKRR
ncbi:hypothetical protein L7F22_054592 [Adiantum nelumboides]|nr:hypothetical protein [Adiantum nelumboides]